jgi:hypothetical protein
VTLLILAFTYGLVELVAQINQWATSANVWQSTLANSPMLVQKPGLLKT